MKLAILALNHIKNKDSVINGTLVQLNNLSLGFSSLGIDVHYISLTNESNKKFEVIDGINFHWIKSNKYPLGWISTIKKYNEILNDLKPESIYVRGRSFLQYIAGKHSLKYNIPYVWGTNGEDGVEKWKKIRRLKKSRRTLLKKYF